MYARPHKIHSRAVADEDSEPLSLVVVRRYKYGGAHDRNAERIAGYSQRDRAGQEPYCTDSAELETWESWKTGI